MTVWDLKTKIIDIETTFLHCDLEENISMEIPSVMEVNDGKCLVLKKRIYVLQQSALELWIHRKFCEPLSMGQEIQFRNSCDGMEIYVDNFLTIGTDECIKEFINNF
jgi:hypothetical protein